MNTTNASNIANESAIEAVWVMPLWVWLSFSIAAFAFVFWLYRSERGRANRITRIALATLRWSLIMLIFWMLSGWKQEQFRTERPTLAVVIDRSQSMDTADVESNSGASSMTRFQALAKSIASVPNGTRRSLSSNYDLKWFTTGTSLLPLALQNKSSESTSDETTNQRPAQSQIWPESLDEIPATQSSSLLGDSLSQLVDRYTGRQAAAIVLLSDGINTAGRSLSDVERLARASGIPIFTVTYGREIGLPDLRLVDLQLENEVYLGDRVTCEVSVLSSDVEEITTSVIARHAETGKVLDETAVQIHLGENQTNARLSFVPDSSGTLPIEFEVVAANGETDTDNNSIRRTIEVVDKTLNVLLLQESPNYEFRFLKHFLERTVQKSELQTVSFELVSVLQESDPDYVAQDRSARRLVPSQDERIAEIDVFVLGRFDPSLVSRRSQQAIYDAVTERGAGCVFVLSDPTLLQDLSGWPLGELLPVVPPQSQRGGTLGDANANSTAGNWKWSPTELGANSPPLLLADTLTESRRIWNQLPALDQLCDIGSTKVGAQVLIAATQSGDQRPLLVSQYAGAGRVVYQGCAETYRWTSFGGSDVYHQRYWGQLLRWCSRGKLSSSNQNSQLKVEPSRVKAGRTVRMEATIGTEISDASLPDSATVRVLSDTQTPTAVTLTKRSQSNRVYVGSTQNLLPGMYEAVLVQPTPAIPAMATFEVLEPEGELSSLKANVTGMQQLARGSRGKSYASDQLPQLFQDLPTGTATRVGSLPPKPIWNAWWVALAFVLLITIEWLLRRQVRML